MDNVSVKCKPMKVFKIIGMVIAGLFTAVIVALIFGYVVQWLWNWLMPQIFHLQKIDFWQAFGLVFLLRLLFGHLGMEAEHDPKQHHHHHGPHHGHHKPRFNCEKHWNWCCDEDDDDDWKEAKDYKVWWENEGKQAYEDYVMRKKTETDSEC